MSLYLSILARLASVFLILLSDNLHIRIALQFQNLPIPQPNPVHQYQKTNSNVYTSYFSKGADAHLPGKPVSSLYLLNVSLVNIYYFPKCLENRVNLLWHYGISVTLHLFFVLLISAHPIGNPIIHSTYWGFMY